MATPAARTRSIPLTLESIDEIDVTQIPECRLMGQSGFSPVILRITPWVSTESHLPPENMRCSQSRSRHLSTHPEQTFACPPWNGHAPSYRGGITTFPCRSANPYFPCFTNLTKPSWNSSGPLS